MKSVVTPNLTKLSYGFPQSHMSVTPGSQAVGCALQLASMVLCHGPLSCQPLLNGLNCDWTVCLGHISNSCFILSINFINPTGVWQPLIIPEWWKLFYAIKFPSTSDMATWMTSKFSLPCGLRYPISSFDIPTRPSFVFTCCWNANMTNIPTSVIRRGKLRFVYNFFLVEEILLV